MRIGFFTDGFLPQPNGVATSVSESAKELERRGHEVFIIAPKYPGYIDHSTNVIRLPSIKVLKLPETRLAPSFPDKSLGKIFSMDFDIIHGHSGGPITFLGREIARAKDIPFVITYHTLWNRYTHYFFKGKIVTPKLMERATKIFANRVDYLIAPTSRVEHELRSYGIKKPIAIIPSGIDIEKFQNSKKGFLRKKLGLGDEPLLLFVGRLSREKSVEFLIRAFQDVARHAPGTHFAIVGEGQDKKRLEQLAKKIKVGKNVHFIGKIKNDEIHQIYPDATVFVFSSTTETQGLVILEALASGVPVVAIDDPAYECIKNGENGYLVKKDKIEFAFQTLAIINNNKLHSDLSIKAKLSSQEFSVKTMVDKLEPVYYGLLEKYNKESTARIMKQNERQEQFFIISLSFWASVIFIRILIFLTHTGPVSYPILNIGDSYFFHPSIGLVFFFIALSAIIKKRTVSFLPLILLGVGAGWIIDGAWSVISGREPANYWSLINLIFIFLFGLLLLPFIRFGKKDKSKFYIGIKEQTHITPPSPHMSIVIPAYNEGEFIRATLKSILNQTYKNFELIVVDNNSTDNTAQVAKEYRARVVYEKQKGVAAARQAGFFASKGHIIATTDADAVVPENWLEKIAGEFEKDEKLVGFSGLSRLYSGPVQARAAARYLFYPFWFIDKIFSSGWNMLGSNMAVRRDAFLKIGGFRTNLTLGEDVDLAQRLKSVGKIKVDGNFAIFASGRRYKNGLLSGVLVYAPSWFSRVILKKEEFLNFPAVRSEKQISSKLSYLPLITVALFLTLLFYLSNRR